MSGAELDGNSPELLDAAEVIIGDLLNMSQTFEGFGVHKVRPHPPPHPTTNYGD